MIPIATTAVNKAIAQPRASTFGSGRRTRQSTASAGSTRTPESFVQTASANRKSRHGVVDRAPSRQSSVPTNHSQEEEKRKTKIVRRISPMCENVWVECKKDKCDDGCKSPGASLDPNRKNKGEKQGQSNRGAAANEKNRIGAQAIMIEEPFSESVLVRVLPRPRCVAASLGAMVEAEPRPEILPAADARY